MKTISVLIPVYNEQEVLDHLYSRLIQLAKDEPKYHFEFFFVNDGSRDETLSMIKHYAEIDTRVGYLNFSRNFGKEIAMIAGLDHVIGDATVIIDADLQDPPELIHQMIDFWEEGYDDVYARRRSRSGETWLKKTTSKMYYRLLQRVSEIEIQPDTGDFRLLDRRVVDALKQFRESERYTKGMFSWVGFRKKEIIYDRDPRAAGSTHFRYGVLVNFAIDGITSFTTAPLRLSTYLGFFISLIAFVYIIVIIFQTIFGSHLSGYPSMMAVILFLGGVQLVSLGIIGEYIARIFNETKQRPLYLVEELHTSSIPKKK